ncbi:uncharacterized protein J7T54_003288 [Emericellopsis cladophorae]|uniref:Uncharacterized protein n=1 Tax=Emericellopsis cladophorae TaxID=2686198 RepID=A0A9P9Y0I9_9HYPO|nr:uncharacterized protein J7T54_003288 [Emericellopsis cladophorae]KAI6781120.1 hypothetical protein J7T54_003288 [Emericellopsis cladophorae]
MDLVRRINFHESELPLDGSSVSDRGASPGASFERQFLRLAENELEKGIRTQGAANPYNLANLRFFNSLLHQQTSRIKATMLCISNTNPSKWPKVDDDVTKGVRRAVEQDYLNLHEYADALYRRCREEIVVLINSIAIAESVNGITQAEQIEKLTFMAFIFALISFTSAVFSMNAPELQRVTSWPWFDGKLRL